MVDPITVEIIRRSLLAAAEEAKIVLTRSSHNPIIYEVLDFSVGVFDSQGNTLAQAPGLPIFIANLGAAILDGLKVIGADNMLDGDVIITNDPYTTGTHLPDMTIYAPVVYEGELVGFVGSRAHWVDVGGRAPGGWFTDTQEVYQEGLRLRSVKLVERGKINDNVVRIITSNVRYPESIYGDMRAQIAAVNAGVKRFKEIIDKYGIDTFNKAIELMMKQSEEYVRSEIRKMEGGTYSAVGFLERILSEEPIRISVKVLVDNERGEIVMDFTGTSQQIPEPLNCGSAAAISAARVAFRAVIRPDLPTDEGTYRPLNVNLPPGTVISAQPPAPVALYGLPLMTLIDAVVRALSKARPQATIAGMYDDVDATFIWSRDPRTGKPYIHIEPQPGGWGAKPFEDGENALIAIADGDTYNVPIEVLENRYPLLIEQYSLVQNSGGPGKYRGGLGMVRSYYIDHQAYCTLTYFRYKYPAWGLFNGYPAGGVNTIVVIEPDGKIVNLQKVTAYELKPGTRLILLSGGGGGWGDPLERDPELVLNDLMDGYISEEHAKEVYGIIVDRVTKTIDQEATRLARAAKKTQRIHPHECPKCGSIDPLTSILPRIEDHRLFIKHIYLCPTCNSILWVNEAIVNINAVFQ
ncbi:MAG TPA: hydantoinase B/oxoprolinase family protein [Sulfolobales archaeon]|nr:hydantoinase B/oxoprolinase family protein [Sulfolobales archaeon]